MIPWAGRIGRPSRSCYIFQMQEQIETLLEEVLRPLVEADGGSIELVEFSEDRVVFRLGGACSGCPGLVYTEGDVLAPAVRSILGDEVGVEVVRGKA